jgi:hypothetical protein
MSLAAHPYSADQTATQMAVILTIMPKVTLKIMPASGTPSVAPRLCAS